MTDSATELNASRQSRLSNLSGPSAGSEEWREQQTKELTEVPDVGETLAAALIKRFGSIYGVSRRACSSWGALADVGGMSEDRAREFFHELVDAGVYVGSGLGREATVRGIRAAKEAEST